MRIGTIVEFEAAHRQFGDTGKCGSLHGHNWKAKVDIVSDELLPLGYVVDFKVVKDYVSKYDHVTLLRKDDPLIRSLKRQHQKVVALERNPTCEVLATVFAKDIFEIVSEHVKVKKVHVVILENDNSWAEMRYDAADRDIPIDSR